MPNVIETAERFKRELFRNETTVTNDLITTYQKIVNRLEDKLTVLMSRIEVLESQGNLSAESIRKQAVWSSLLNQIEDEIKRYGGFVDAQNQLSANKAIDLAGKHSQQLTGVYFENNPSLSQAFNATWDRLPNESIERLLGFLQPDSQLSINLNQSLGSNAAQNFRDKLLEGIALGYNPRKIDSLINQTLSEPLTWALNTVTTTQQYAYRESSRANYINNSEIVGGWKWYAALDGRVCLSCVSKHGQSFTVEQRLNDHHRGRCTQIPLIKDSVKFGLQDPDIIFGESWFNQLPLSQQQERMGYDRHKAYQQGKFRFSDLSETYQNDVFGEMLKERSLKSLLNLEKPSSRKITDLRKDPPKLFDLKDDVKSLEKELNKAAELITKAHKLPKDYKPVTVKNLGNDEKTLLASYRPDTAVIGVKDLKGIVNSTLHEFGHHIDYGLIGNSDGRSRANGSEIFDDWQTAIRQSSSYKELVKLKSEAQPIKTSKGTISIPPEYIDYLLQYDELWARSYAQYVLRKNGLDILQNDDDVLINSKQWSTEDFTNIEKTIDGIFRKLRWN